MNSLVSVDSKGYAHALQQSDRKAADALEEMIKSASNPKQQTQ